jgi:hypothetical protein
MLFVERVVIVVYAVDLIFNEQRFCKPFRAVTFSRLSCCFQFEKSAISAQANLVSYGPMLPRTE